MKIVLAYLLIALAVAQAVIPRDIIIPEEKLFPKKTLKEWQELLKNVKYYPSYAPKTKGIPQPDSSGKALTPRIVGGSVATSGQFPWQVSIIMDGNYFCGGSIISSNWILTAGHCVSSISSFLVRAGSLESQSGGQSQLTYSSILHSGYNSNTISNDIGLIRLSTPLTLGSTINSVKLPPSSIGSLEGSTARVSGWGRTSDTSGVSSFLNWVDLPIISSDICLAYYGYFTSAQICASGSGPKSTCNGDSGGPFVIQGSDTLWTEVGIVSFGSDRGCERGYPLGFTRVSSYLDWISSNTGLSL